jgi:hypothetical protein
MNFSISDNDDDVDDDYDDDDYDSAHHRLQHVASRSVVSADNFFSF